MAFLAKATAKASGAVTGARKALAGYSGIFPHLSAEHAEVDALMHRVASSHDSNLRLELFLEICGSLRAHMQSEEEAFYPRLRALSPLPEVVAACEEEHRRVKEYLAQLEMMPSDEVGWIELFERLKDSVEAHVDREENDLFPKANALLSAQEATEILNRYEQVEKVAKARG